jgi:hypothetical protein
MEPQSAGKIKFHKGPHGNNLREIFLDHFQDRFASELLNNFTIYCPSIAPPRSPIAPIFNYRGASWAMPNRRSTTAGKKSAKVRCAARAAEIALVPFGPQSSRRRRGRPEKQAK